MVYYDEWHIRFESLKKKNGPEPLKTEFISFTKPNTDIDLTQNQVEQFPVPLND